MPRIDTSIRAAGLRQLQVVGRWKSHAAVIEQSCRISLAHRPSVCLQTLRPYRASHQQRRWNPSSSFQSASTLTSNDADPTIYALSTAPGRAAIAIIRVSGPAVTHVYHSLCPNKPFPKPRHATIRSLYSPTTPSTLLDSSALLLFFPGPRTATGEDLLELHVHGGPAIIAAVLAAISACTTPSSPIRYAEPGEFTRRAFFNARLTLPQVEALGDTLAAVTEEQRCLAVQGTVSGLAARYDAWRLQLLAARGELEALIDFSEDQHFDESPAELASNVAVQIRRLQRSIALHRANAVRGELLRGGIGISLVGAPNAGKSSLLNLIVGRNAAIVSSEAGTTRDVVEVGIDLGGFFCRLGDTAGLRGSKGGVGGDAASVLKDVVGEIEKEGMRRAKEKALQSDVVLLVLSVEPSLQGQGAALSLADEVLDTAHQLLQEGKRLVVVVNKMDHYGPLRLEMTDSVQRAVCTALPLIERPNIFCISCLDAERSGDAVALDPGGIHALLLGLTYTFKAMTTALTPSASDSDDQTPFDASQWQESLGATQRQGALLEECAGYLSQFLAQVSPPQPSLRETADPSSTVGQPGGPKASDHATAMLLTRESVKEDDGCDIVVAAEALRGAAGCLARITGSGGEAGDVEEVLGVVFEKFCIGK